MKTENIRIKSTMKCSCGAEFDTLSNKMSIISKLVIYVIHFIQIKRALKNWCGRKFKKDIISN